MPDRHINSKKNSTNVLLRALGYLLWGLWLAAPQLTSRLALKWFFRPRSVRQKQDELDVWQSGTAFTMTLHGRTLRGRYWGDGPGVLMMHGWNGRGSQFYRFIDPVVAQGYRAILLDGPAHGDSEGNYTTYFEFTDAVRHLLRGGAGMPVEKVVAHSFGAGAVINALDKEALKPDVVLIAPALALEEIVLQSFQRAGFPGPLYRNLIDWLEQRYGYDLHRDNPYRLLRKLSSAVLLLHDRGDKIVPFEVSEQFTRGLPHLVLKATEGFGHIRILQEQGAIETAMEHLFGPQQGIMNP